jgi:hypothetical protein
MMIYHILWMPYILEKFDSALNIEKLVAYIRNRE